jgi:hypothetical protein
MNIRTKCITSAKNYKRMALVHILHIIRNDFRCVSFHQENDAKSLEKSLEFFVALGDLI